MIGLRPFEHPTPDLGAPRVGVCSWSLRCASAAELAERVRACGVRSVQLALDPLRTGAWETAETFGTLTRAGITIASGMMGTQGEDYSTLETIRNTGGVRPTVHWAANLRAAEQNARIARRLGLRLVTFHAGFLPHDRADAERALLVRRLAAIVGIFGAEGVRVAFETGQERAETLLEVLADLQQEVPLHGQIGVNFDPANMILYGMGDPIDALRRLARWVRQIHIKDATPTAVPGTWGEERRAGEGAVDWTAFFRATSELGLNVGLMIEREAGESRVEDICAARTMVERLAPSPRMVRPLRLGVVGLGFMGRTHLAAITAAHAAGFPCSLAAVADRDPARFAAGAATSAGNLATGASAAVIEANVRTFTSPDALIASDAIDALCICTHTDTHVPLALAALAAGKHVLIEKPIALTSDHVAAVANAAHDAGRLAAPAMCMRFWPGWTDLARAVRDGRYGAVLSATFQRLGSRPDWAPSFYGDAARSGGALGDLHIHDVDFINGLFGPAKDLRSHGTLEHLSTQFTYGPDGPAHVLAEGSQRHHPGFGFRMRFVVIFERATLDFDLARAAPLHCATGDSTAPVVTSALSAYDAQTRAFVEHAVTGVSDGPATIDDAFNAARLLERARASLRG